MTARDFVVHMGELRGLPRRVAVLRASEVLFQVGLEEERSRLIGTFSVGMKQRTNLAQAIVHSPRLVVLDEPTNGLDPAGREEMLALVRRLSHRARDRGVDVVARARGHRPHLRLRDRPAGARPRGASRSRRVRGRRRRPATCGCGSRVTWRRSLRAPPAAACSRSWTATGCWCAAAIAAVLPGGARRRRRRRRRPARAAPGRRRRWRSRWWRRSDEHRRPRHRRRRRPRSTSPSPGTTGPAPAACRRSGRWPAGARCGRWAPAAAGRRS